MPNPHEFIRTLLRSALKKREEDTPLFNELLQANYAEDEGDYEAHFGVPWPAGREGAQRMEQERQALSKPASDLLQQMAEESEAGERQGWEDAKEQRNLAFDEWVDQEAARVLPSEASRESSRDRLMAELNAALAFEQAQQAKIGHALSSASTPPRPGSARLFKRLRPGYTEYTNLP